MSIEYRADIDGLRAIAVAAVILYHAHVPGFAGGFVGVDVFFVVSGYLITSLLVADARHKGISIRDFYDRRIRRIFPALFVVMSATVVAGAFIYAPADFERLGRSVLAASLFYSNVWFWLDSNYFEVAESLRPLLHTWSLAVEEQFYVFFPLLLILTIKFLHQRLVTVVAVVATVSLLLAAVMVERAPSATFYLLPTRAWELLLGSLLALRPLHVSNNAVANNWLVVVGLGVIALCTSTYSEATQFPGLSAIPPTVATAMIIVGGAGAPSAATRLLASGPLVLIGKMSYSLYLWHFPIFAYAAYLSIDALSPVEIGLLVAVCVVLSWFSWRFVELPARRRVAGRGRNWVFAFGALLMLAMAGVAVLIQAYRGIPERFEGGVLEPLDAARDFNSDRGDCSVLGKDVIEEGGLCVLGSESGPISFVLWGDSHGEVLRPAVSAAASLSGRRGVFLGSSGCPPLVGYESSEQRKCMKMSANIAAWIQRQPSIDTVIIASRWALWSTGKGVGEERVDREPLARAIGSGGLADGDTDLEGIIDATIRSLFETRKLDVWLVGPIPEVGIDVPRAMFVQARGFDTDVSLEPDRREFDRRQTDVISALRRVAAVFQGVNVVWPHEVLCGRETCSVVRGKDILYFDDDHLSRAGVAMLEPAFHLVFSEDQRRRIAEP